MKKIVEQQWDYTKHAEFYCYRPNYSPQAISLLVKYVNYIRGGGFLKVADIGAGTGNLSVMLLERGCEVVSVEPNDAMREIGIKRTENQKINWIKATGINTELESESFDWVTFGSSFNVMDRSLALVETHRILKDNGVFSCMWNHRDLNDPIQEMAEEVIESLVPDYSRGVRREDQRSVIESHRHLFDEIFYFEQDFYFHQSIENYLLAWKSVKNPYWDLETQEGRELFEKISYQMKHKLPREFSIKYTTRIWSAKKI